MNKIYHTIQVRKNSVSGFIAKMFIPVITGLLCIWSTANAQQVDIGGTNYTTLKGAFDAINLGTHTGAITIDINATTTETATALLNSSGTGAASYTSILIKPTAAAIIGGNIAGAIIKLSGADNVTIDGFIGAGPARSLTINNTSTSTASAIVWIASASGSDPATNNVVKNCVVTGNAPTTTFIGIVSSSGTTLGGVAEAQNSNNTYQNNLVTACWYGIAVVGPSGNEANTVISNNTLGSTGAAAAGKIGFKGIAMFQQQDVLISQNTILGVAGATGSGTSQTSGIFVAGTASGGLIERNNISNIRITGPWGSNGIQLQSTSPTTNLTIANNFIYDIASGGFGSANSVDDGPYGIAVNTGGAYNFYYNSIDLSTNTSGISASFWISTTATALNVRNNIFSNRQTAGTRYSIYSNSGSSVFTAINYNDYFSSGSVGFLGAAQATLGNWQTATGQDANSVSVNPAFVSVTDLHVTGSSPMNALATSGTGIVIDYDNAARDVTTPDIGADEFTPPICSSNNGGTATSNPTSICVSGSATLSSTGFAFGVGIAYQWEYFNGAIWVDLPGQTNPNSASTGIISATTQYRLRVTCAAGAPGYSNTVTVIAATPQVTGSAGATRCGVGTVNLTATGTGPLYWYTAPTGGLPIGTGSPFTTPTISANTTYYVGVTLGGTPESGGMPSSPGTDGSFLTNAWGVVFDATIPFTLTSAVIYPTGTGTITVGLYNSSGTEIVSTAPINITGSGISTPVTLPLGFTVPTGTGYRLLVKDRTGITNLIRDFSAPFPFPSPSGAINVTSGWNGGITTANYFFYNLMISAGCESAPRVAVTATVTAAPAFSAGPTATPATICSGQSTNLSVSSANAYTYVWTPGNLTGANQTVSPATTTTYTVTGTDVGGCVRIGTVTVTVNPTPTTLVVTPNAISVCPGVVQTITTSGGIMPNQAFFTDLFETFPLTKWTDFNTGTGTITSAQNATYYQQGNSSVHLTNGDGADGGIVTVNSINLSAYTSPVLTFAHICAEEKTFDFGYVQYSDNGGPWTSFPTSSYSGGGVLKNGVVSFDASSYTDWNSQFTVAASTPGTGPATSLWKMDTINLNTWQASNNFKIRFRVTSDGSVSYYGWLIDNVNIKGTGQGAVTWSPATELWLDAAAVTTPYVLGTPASTVYSKPTVSRTYTAIVGTSPCTSSATSTLTVASLPVSVSIAANPGINSCTGQPVTFTATPVNGGANPFYRWYVNGIEVTNGIGVNTYTTSTLVTGNTVSCTLLSSAGGCTTYPSGIPAPSNVITMTVHPYPTVTITSAGTTVCNGSTTLLSISATTGTSYQWNLNTNPIPLATASTYAATLPGSYTLTVFSSPANCATISNAIVLTLPTYTINATPGANGNITPSGAVVVDCGNNQTFNITPNAGYAICDVVVDGTSVGTPASYTFNNVVANGHTITATFCIVGCGTPPTANAGPDVSICANVNHTLAGSVGGSATANLSSWSTSGSGTFNPNNNFSTATSYTASAADILAGSVILTLTTNDPDGAGPCLASSDQMTLTLRPIPSVSISGLLGICPASNTTLTANASLASGTITGYQWFNGATPLGTASTQLVSATGNYSLVVNGSNGCNNSAAVVIVNFAPPTISISGPTVICTNETIVLTASATAGSGTIGATAYQWVRGGIDQPGETGPAYVVNSAGVYTVRVTNSNGCTTTSASHTVTVDNAPLSGVYTIGVGAASCTNYSTFATAFSDLNKRGVGGFVRFDVPAGYTETAPVGGLMLGSNVNAILSGSLSSTNTVTFQKSGPGANPKITAHVGNALPTSAIPDGIVHLKGVSYITFDGIDLTDANAANPGTMEYGYGLFKVSATRGSQNNTIQNCVITMNRANGTTATGGTPMPDGSQGILVINSMDSSATTAITPSAASGSNSNNKFYGNTIQNTNGGIALSGFATASTTLGDVGNDIGGIAPITGNSILNYGGIAGAANAANGIRLINQLGVNVSYNTINNNNGAGINHVNLLRGIYAESGISANATLGNNTITVTSASNGFACIAIENGIGSTPSANTVLISNNIITGGYSATVSGNWSGIVNTSNAATVNIIGNTIQNVIHSGTGIWAGISNIGASANAVNLNINNNVIQNCNVTSTGAYNPIINSTTVTNLTIDGNQIRNNTRTAASVTAVNLITIGGITAPTSPANANVVNNNISGNIMAAGGSNFIFIGVIGSLTNINLSGNTIYNNGVTGISGTGAATIRGYSNTSGNTFPELVANNIVRKLYVTGTSTSLQIVQGINVNTNSGSSRTVSGNTVDSIYSDATLGAAIIGISSGSGATVNIFKNKISALYAGQNAALAAFAKGLAIASGTTVTAYNNIINLDLTGAAPAVNSVLVSSDAVKGIEVSNGTTINLYYNTIRMNGAGSGGAFGSNGIGITSTTPVVNMRNNLISNLMTPGGTTPGFTVALRRSAAAVTGYASTSNYNSFYAGVASASRLLYFDGTNSYQTLAALQGGAGIAPREANSIAFAPTFVSATDLHLDPANNCAIDGQGIPITSPFAITDDYAATVRNATLPDIGAYEYTGLGSPNWKGLTTDWMNTNNWCGVLPTVVTDVVIPNGVPNYPNITTGAPVSRSISIAASASVTIAATGTLTVKGNFANSGTLTNNGRIVLDGISAQSFPGSGTVAAMNELEINNASSVANIDKAFAITGALLPTLGKVKLNNFNITLRSTATATARVGAVGTTDAFDYSGGTGRFVVERYVATGTGGGLHGKTWQFLSVPTKGQFVRDAWQEGNAPTLNAVPGFGTIITSEKPGGVGRGYDFVTVPGPTMKTYDYTIGASGGWVSVDDGTTNTSALPIANQKGYMLFVRGDRSVQTSVAAATPTTLRTTGRLYAPGVEVPAVTNVVADKFESIGNPYASAVDFTLVNRTGGVQNLFYVWDPRLAGSYGLGGYQTLSAAAGWLPVPGGTTNYPATLTSTIQSGQAFLVRASGTPGTVTFVEGAKVSGSSVVFRPYNPNMARLRTSLFSPDSTGAFTTMADGNVVAFDGEFSNDTDESDAVKVMNAGENFGMARFGKSLAIEGRAPIAVTDTVFYEMTNLRRQAYEFKFAPENMAGAEVKAWLVDKFLDSKTDISLVDPTVVSFAITDAPASSDPSRFYLVFRNTRPTTFASVRATRQQADILVDWKIDNEFNIASYEVEKSADNNSFNKVNQQQARNNGSATTPYSWLDTNPWTGDNFYRIRSVGISGEVKYSQSVKVTMEKRPSVITVFPNPVAEDGQVFVNMSNKPAGIYQLSLLNNEGQTVLKRTVNHAGGNGVYPISIDRSLAHGNYLLNVMGDDRVKFTFKIVY